MANSRILPFQNTYSILGIKFISTAHKGWARSLATWTAGEGNERNMFRFKQL
jgi:hypothetical protein